MNAAQIVAIYAQSGITISEHSCRIKEVQQSIGDLTGAEAVAAANFWVEMYICEKQN